MFSDPYRGVKYFGHWADETADAFGGRDALAVLRDAVVRCADEDMRTPDVLAALAFLAARATRGAAFADFRRGLDLPDPETRSAAILAAYSGIAQIVGAGAVPRRSR